MDSVHAQAHVIHRMPVRFRQPSVLAKRLAKPLFVFRRQVRRPVRAHASGAGAGPLAEPVPSQEEAGDQGQQWKQVDQEVDSPRLRLKQDPLTVAAHEVGLDLLRRFARGEPIIASDGSQLTLHADSLCVHGDNAESVAVVARIRAALDAL